MIRILFSGFMEALGAEKQFYGKLALELTETLIEMA